MNDEHHPADFDDESGATEVDPVLEQFFKELEDANSPDERKAVVARHCKDHPERTDEWNHYAGASIAGALHPTRAGLPSLPGMLTSSEPIELKAARTLGAGGQGLVVPGTQVSLDGRPVAVKLMFPRSGSDPEDARRRFANERHFQARLHHTGVMPIYTTGDVDFAGATVSYFTMPDFAGVSLDKVVSTARKESASGSGKHARELEKLVSDSQSGGGDVQTTGGPETGSPADSELHEPNRGNDKYWQSVARVVIQIADAVQHVHDKKIVHRDLKPHNVMINPQGECMLIDFGLAREFDPDGNRDSTASNDEPASATDGTRCIGTPNYYAPELMNGRFDYRTDVWGLGTILYELLTLRKPYAQFKLTDLLQEPHFSQLVPPRKHIANLPRDLKAICLRCLELDPSRRYSSAKELSDDLRNWLAGTPVSARPWSVRERAERAVQWGRRHPAWVTTGVSVVLAALAVIGGLTWHSNSIEAAYDEEKAARNTAESRLEHIREFEYGLRMVAASNAWRNNNVGHVRNLLKQTLPENTGGHDFRRWEWHFLNRVSHGSTLLTLDAHSGAVRCIDYRPDGRRLVSGGENGLVKVWHARTGKELRRLREHRGRVNQVAFSPNGEQIASAGEDTRVVVWNAANGKRLHVLNNHVMSVSDLAFNNDGTRLVTGSDDGTLKLWDPQSGKELRTLQGHTNKVVSVSFGPTGQWIVSTAKDRSIRVWSANSGELVRTIEPEQKALGLRVVHFKGVTFGGGDRVFALASSSTKADVLLSWDRKTGNSQRPILTKRRDLTSLRSSRDGRLLITTGRDSVVRMWDISRRREVQSLQGHEGQVNATAMNRDATRLASAGADGTVRVWDATRSTEAVSLTGHVTNVTSVAFSPDGQRLASASFDHTIRIWDIAQRKEVLRLGKPLFNFARFGGKQVIQNVVSRDGHRGLVMAVAYSPDGKSLASASLDNTVRIWDARTGASRFVLKQSAPVFSVAFSPDGTLLASGGWDDTVRLWNVKTGQNVRTMAGHARHVEGVAFSPNGKVVASASLDNTVRLWRVADGKLLHTLAGHTAEVRQVAFSPNGKRLASGSDDHTVQVWDVMSGKRIQGLVGHTHRIDAISFHPKGHRLVSVGFDDTVRLWNLKTGHETLILKGQNAVAFSTDGNRLATVGRYHRVKIWNATPRKQPLDVQPAPAQPKPGSAPTATAKDPTAGIKVLGYSIVRRVPRNRRGNPVPVFAPEKRDDRFVVALLSIPRRELIPSEAMFQQWQRTAVENGRVPLALTHRARFARVDPADFWLVISGNRKVQCRVFDHWHNGRIGFTQTASIANSSEFPRPETRLYLVVGWELDKSRCNGPFQIRFRKGKPIAVPELKLRFPAWWSEEKKPAPKRTNKAAV